MQADEVGQVTGLLDVKARLCRLARGLEIRKAETVCLGLLDRNPLALSTKRTTELLVKCASSFVESSATSHNSKVITLVSAPAPFTWFLYYFD